MIMIDPPSGWMYGFPKPYTPKKGQSTIDWLKENGYPAEKLKDGLAWCRFWEVEDET